MVYDRASPLPHTQYFACRVYNYLKEEVYLQIVFTYFFPKSISPGSWCRCNKDHYRMTRGGHGHLKLSSGPAMPNPSMPCGWVTPEMASRPVQGSPAGQEACGRLLPPWTPHAVRKDLHLHYVVCINRNI
jgi:hypothetical protein